MITGIHNDSSLPQFSLVPLRLFNVQQQVYPGVSDHETFRRNLYEEFAHCTDVREGKIISTTSSEAGSRPPSSYSNKRWPSRRGRLSRSFSITDNPLVPSASFGGIMVSNQVTVDVTEYGDSNSNGGLEMPGLGVTTEAGYAGSTYDTFVDELCSLCRVTAELHTGPL
jgi:hypothetical protein